MAIKERINILTFTDNPDVEYQINDATGENSFAYGTNLKVTGDNQVVFGKNNRDDKDLVFAIGNGKNSGKDGRKNILEVYKDGRALLNDKPLFTGGGDDGEVQTTASAIDLEEPINFTAKLDSDFTQTGEFDGTIKNVTVPVTGILPITKGGTGSDQGIKALVDLSQSSSSPSSIGGSNTTIPVKGTLPVAYGGTGKTTLKDLTVDLANDNTNLNPKVEGILAEANGGTGASNLKTALEGTTFKHTATASQQFKSDKSGIDLNNSDMINVNGIWVKPINGAGQGIHFQRRDESSKWDTIYALDGKLWFTPKHAKDVYYNGNEYYEIYSSKNFSLPIPISQGGTGATSVADARTNLGIKYPIFISTPTLSTDSSDITTFTITLSSAPTKIEYFAKRNGAAKQKSVITNFSSNTTIETGFDDASTKPKTILSYDSTNKKLTLTAQNLYRVSYDFTIYC